MDKSDVIKYYDEEVDYNLVWKLSKYKQMHYGFWDNKTWTFGQALLRTNQVLAEQANIHEDERVLDAGCGVGGSAIWLAKNIGCQVTGITLSKKQVRSALKNASQAGVTNKVHFKVMDYAKTNFPDNSFHVVWAIESVCYAEDKKNFLKEAHRLLKPRGRIIIADFFKSKEHMNSKERRLYKGMVDGWRVKDFSTVNYIKKSLQEIGYKKIVIRDVTKNVQPLARRLYVAFFIGLVARKIISIWKTPSKRLMGNLWTSYYQWKALEKGLWTYDIINAEIPS